MENLVVNDITFHNSDINDYLSKFKEIKSNYNSNMVDFLKLLNELKSVFSCEYEEKYCSSHLAWAVVEDLENNPYNYYEFCERILNLDKSYVRRLNKVFDRFVKRGAGAPLKFSVSKLIELLVLDDETIIDLISRKMLFESMTRKEIRQLVKSLKGTTIDEETEDSEDNIPMAFDPVNTYEFSYFDSMSKNQLINIVWAYHTFIHKKGNNGK